MHVIASYCGTFCFHYRISPHLIWVIPVVLAVGSVGVAGIYITYMFRVYRPIIVGGYRIIKYGYDQLRQIL